MAPATRYQCKTCQKSFIKDFFVSNDSTYELCLFCQHHTVLSQKLDEGLQEIKILKDQNKILSDQLHNLIKENVPNKDTPSQPNNQSSQTQLSPPPGFQPISRRNPYLQIPPMCTPHGYPQPLPPISYPPPTVPYRSAPLDQNRPSLQVMPPPLLSSLDHFPPITTPAQPFQLCSRRRRASKKPSPPQDSLKISNRFAVLEEVGEENEKNSPPTDKVDSCADDSSLILGDSLVRGLAKFVAKPKTKRIVQVYPGARINHIKKVIQESVLPDKKSSLVVNIGSNDIYRKEATSEHYVADYIDLIDTLKDRADNVIVVGVLPRRKVGTFVLSRALHVNNRVKEYCEQKAKISFIDPWDEFIHDRRLYQSDGIHPSTKGTKLLASLIDGRINVQLKSKNFC